jgi:hypothetical protein
MRVKAACFKRPLEASTRSAYRPVATVTVSATREKWFWPTYRDLSGPQAQVLARPNPPARFNGRCYTSMSTFWRICWISSSVVYSPGRGGGAFHGEAV